MTEKTQQALCAFETAISCPLSQITSNPDKFLSFFKVVVVVVSG